MAEWLDIVFEKTANYLNKFNEIIDNNYDIGDERTNEIFMDKFVNYKDASFGDKIGWNVEYEPVWAGEGKVMGWMPKNEYIRGKRASIVFEDLEPNYKIKFDKYGFLNINGNKYTITFDSAIKVEKRGLYDLCIDNHIDIPESISKDSPCYKQFMKEKEVVE